MGNWGVLGGHVFNKSSKKLIVAYNDPDDESQWAHSLLLPGKSTAWNLDVDGFRCQDTKLTVIYKPMIGADVLSADWFKISNTQFATVVDDGKNVSFKISDSQFITWFTNPKPKSNSDFDYTEGETLKKLG